MTCLSSVTLVKSFLFPRSQFSPLEDGEVRLDKLQEPFNQYSILLNIDVKYT